MLAVQCRTPLELLSKGLDGEFAFGLKELEITMKGCILGSKSIPFAADSFNCTV